MAITKGYVVSKGHSITKPGTIGVGTSGLYRQGERIPANVIEEHFGGEQAFRHAYVNIKDAPAKQIGVDDETDEAVDVRVLREGTEARVLQTGDQGRIAQAAAEARRPAPEASRFNIDPKILAKKDAVELAAMLKERNQDPTMTREEAVATLSRDYKAR